MQFDTPILRKGKRKGREEEDKKNMLHP